MAGVEPIVERPGAGPAVPPRNTGVVVGRDALGNVLVTGDGNTVEVALTVVVADTRLAAAAAPVGDNPYRGLDAFREADSAVFFGREDLIARLWTRFHALQRGGPRLLPILGASGSGKSSLVRAGFLPELVRQPMEGMRDPLVLVLRPGASPLERLADVLARTTQDAGPSTSGGFAVRSGVHALPSQAAASDTIHRFACSLGDAERRVVLFVDQFEELFTECASEVARGAFLATLAHAAGHPDGRVTVLFAMRNDFAGSLRPYDAFAAAVREQRFTVAQMSRAQLIDAIEQPARVLGHPWPGGLVENLVLQCEGRSGALPLLQFALKRLWSEHVAGRLSETRWSSRLIEDFVVHAADALCEGTGTARDRDAHQRIIRRAFVAMVQLGEGTADTRRMARLSEIVARRDTADHVRAVLAPFVAPEARLVTTSEQGGEPTYELAHEALIGSWDRLRGWLGRAASSGDAEAIRSDLRLLRRLRHATEAWQLDGEALWQPPELALAAALRDRAPDELTAADHAFLDASLAARHAQRRWRSRVRLAIAALSIASIAVVSTLALIAWRKAAEAQRRVAESVQLYQDEAAQRLFVAERPLQALTYLVAARESAEALGNPPCAPLRMLFAEATRHLPVSRRLRHVDTVWGAAWSASGKRVVTASSDGTAQIWDADTGAPVLRYPLQHAARVKTAAFSPDDLRVVTASDDGTAEVWDAATGRRLLWPPMRHGDIVNGAAFSPDGGRVVTASNDHTARIWDVSSPAPRLVTELAHRGVVTRAVFSPDATRVVTASQDGTAAVWDAASGRRLCELRHDAGVNQAAFSPDGGRIVTASDDQTADIWDAASCRALLATPIKHDSKVMDAAFNPAGDRVVTASEDETARIWNAASGVKIGHAMRHQALVWKAEFSRDGKRIVTASNDGTARVWDAATGEPLTPALEHESIVWNAAFSPDGTRIATASFDKTARIWSSAASKIAWRTLGDRAIEPFGSRYIAFATDRGAQIRSTDSGEAIATLEPGHDVARAVFGPEGRLVVGVGSDGVAQIHDGRSGASRCTLDRSGAKDAAFSPDGKLVATIVTAGATRVVRVWDAASCERRAEFAHADVVTGAVFSPDGTRIATVCNDGHVRIWSTSSGASTPIWDLAHPFEGITGAAFSPDGTRLVTGGHDGTARIWSAATGQQLGLALQHNGEVWSAAFSPDGTRVVTASEDFTSRIWDANSGQPLSVALPHHKTVWSAAFSPDGARVVTASADGTARVWDVASGEPLSPPLAHGKAPVRWATFTPDGTGVITASGDPPEQIRRWDLPLDGGTLDDWRATADRASPYRLRNGGLSPR